MGNTIMQRNSPRSSSAQMSFTRGIMARVNRPNSRFGAPTKSGASFAQYQRKQQRIQRRQVPLVARKAPAKLTLNRAIMRNRARTLSSATWARRSQPKVIAMPSPKSLPKGVILPQTVENQPENHISVGSLAKRTNGCKLNLVTGQVKRTGRADSAGGWRRPANGSNTFKPHSL